MTKDKLIEYVSKTIEEFKAHQQSVDYIIEVECEIKFSTIYQYGSASDYHITSLSMQ